MSGFLTKTDVSGDEENEPSSLELHVVQERLLEQAAFLQLHEEVTGLTPTPEPSAKKIKLSLGALTSLKKPKECPSAAQSPCDRLSAEIEQYLKYLVIDGDEDPLKWWK